MPSPSSTRKSAAAAQALLSRLARDLHPPIDVERLASMLGFQIVTIQSVRDELSGLVSPKHKIIGVNANHHHRRQRFTLAHELGHIILNHPPESRCSLHEIAELNREADAFASELLVPTQLLKPLLASRTYSPSTLSRLFDVSEEAMILRLKTLVEYPR
ncbi:MAG: ImmA/IrrE family metallo-endopeptidase [Bacteroidetes bacterium]|nr:ImmA/IrrE family metallo-endopeptidase [Bacteroidota bacterium]MCW5894427.1 ImmA/IrrE family metallo-endopeptidase [Bacteroidota bacterium]